MSSKSWMIFVFLLLIQFCVPLLVNADNETIQKDNKGAVVNKISTDSIVEQIRENEKELNELEVYVIGEIVDEDMKLINDVNIEIELIRYSYFNKTERKKKSLFSKDGTFSVKEKGYTVIALYPEKSGYSRVGYNNFFSLKEDDPAKKNFKYSSSTYKDVKIVLKKIPEPINYKIEKSFRGVYKFFKRFDNIGFDLNNMKEFSWRSPEKDKGALEFKAGPAVILHPDWDDPAIDKDGLLPASNVKTFYLEIINDDKNEYGFIIPEQPLKFEEYEIFGKKTLGVELPKDGYDLKKIKLLAPAAKSNKNIYIFVKFKDRYGIAILPDNVHFLGEELYEKSAARSMKILFNQDTRPEVSRFFSKVKIPYNF